VYPAVFHLQRPESLSRLRLILRPVLVLPILIWALPYSLFAGFLHVLAWWSILFSGRHPQLLWDLLEGYFRFIVKIHAYMMCLTDAYPPFSGGADAPSPVRIHIMYPGRLSRSTTVFRPLILFPHYFYCIGYSTMYAAVHFLHFWTILFLGRMAAWQRTQTERYYTYMSRLAAYGMLLVDEYPPFNGAQPRAAERVFSATGDSSIVNAGAHPASEHDASHHADNNAVPVKK